MKYLILLCLFLSPTIYSKSCVTVENGKKTLCNNYDSLKQKDPAKLKKTL